MIGEECQQREMLTVVHRTLDTGRCSRAKSTVEKYAVVQVMELHDESVSRLQTGVHVVVRGQKIGASHSKVSATRNRRTRGSRHWVKKSRGNQVLVSSVA